MEMSLLVSSFLTLILLLAIKLSIKSKLKLPPTPGPALPLIGHLYLLKLPLNRTYRKLAGKLGPIFYLRLGIHRVVVISSPALVQECFTKNDIILAGRPRLLISKYIGYNYTFLPGAPYGESWRKLRRRVEIFSTARLSAFESIRQDEARIMVRTICRISEKNSGRIQLRPLLFQLTFNIIMRMAAGERYFGSEAEEEEAKRFQELIEETLEIAGVSNPLDFLPALRWIDYGGFEKRLNRIGGKMDEFLQMLIEETKKNRGRQTVMDELMELQQSDGEYYTDDVIKGIIIVMLLGGTDTSSLPLEWAMSALLNNPKKLDRARAEIDDVVGVNRLVTESDLPNLPFIRNIISETLRLFPPSPLLLPHEATSDCKIGGYDIHRGTMVMVNAWAIHRDPAIWPDPEIFMPERFESEEADPTKLMPFGMGKRSCPGNFLANRIMGLALGSLIQCFEWRRVDDGLVDMREGKGLALPKVVPLEALCRRRDALKGVILREGFESRVI